MLKKVIPLMLVVFIILSTVTRLTCSQEKPIVVTTTSVLGSIVKDLAGDNVTVVIITSPSICPAHYDIKPSDVMIVAKANLILYHGFEPWIDKLVTASGTKAPLVKISGPWNTPDSLKQYYIKVAQALEKYLRLNVSDRLQICLNAIDKVAQYMKQEAQKYDFSKIKVICMLWQKAFIQWLGFKIVATYPPPERLSVQDISKLESIGKSEKVAFVIDNLQSGMKFGENLAEEVGAIHIVLTNFPGIIPGTNNVTSMFLYNLKTLEKAVENYKLLKEIHNLRNEVNSYTYITIGLAVVIVVESIIIVILLRRRA